MSYLDIVNPEDGKPRDPEFNGINLIREEHRATTVRQMYGMIWYLASELVQDNESSVIDRDEVHEQIVAAYENWRIGLKIGDMKEQPKRGISAVSAVKEYLTDLGVNDIQANAFIINMIDKGIIDPTKKES